ncbi:MAG: glucose-6-phosphate isomerase [Verrucomicrobia bacterium]|nr:glucose-6-phosphate isomerase [Verrucomicrobiota bacterium]
MDKQALWQRYQEFLVREERTGLSLDVSRVRFPDDFFEHMAPAVTKAFAAMQDLEAGGIVNPDEGRMVGHYWLRDATLAPDPSLQEAIGRDRAGIRAFAAAVHGGEIKSAGGEHFTRVISIGIGGSALGPELVADALASAKDLMAVDFIDNTDPDGIDRLFSQRQPEELRRALVLVISKSGGTPEPRNGMLEVKARFEALGIPFAKHAVAITGEGSNLDKQAAAEGWLRRFPMYDWVGGRTSVMSAVGLVPAALQGIDTDAFLAGAAAMDAHTRLPGDPRRNAAMLLALMWYHLGGGRGTKDMVILPYKDRLLLLSRYLQQLVMESLGKEKDLAGATVHQGIAVYGNKGSTDQHAYVQQLRDGVANFFATFIEVRQDRDRASAHLVPQDVQVEPNVTSGDYLQGFLRGTRTALYENDRDSITISIPEVTPQALGALIALYERAVGFYGSLVNINAYHQPGVEAGKKAAGKVLDLQARVKSALQAAGGRPQTVRDLAAGLGADTEDVYHLLVHLTANSSSLHQGAAARPGEETYWQR